MKICRNAVVGPYEIRSSFKRAVCLGSVAFWIVFQAHAHSLPVGDMQVNAPTMAAERDQAKLFFLESQAKRSSVAPNQIQAARSIYQAAYQWSKREIKVCFWNGTEEQQRDVIRISDVWHQAVPGVRFNFGDSDSIRQCSLTDLRDETGMPDIRIALESNRSELYHSINLASKNGDWSYPGKAVSKDPAYPTTMNLVASMDLRRRRQTIDYFFNVRHEFGHAMALVHEHQREVCKGKFNVQAIADSQGWTFAYAAAQVEALPDSSNNYNYFGAYDNKSIMQYNFLQAWYMPDQGNKVNPCRRDDDVFDLSELDKVVVANLYQPSLNETPERKAFIAQVTRGESSSSQVSTDTGNTGQNANQSASIVRALQSFNPGVGRVSSITIQIYPHKVDRDVVLKTVANLGYPVVNGRGEKIVQVSANTNETLGNDPTSTLLYTADVSEQEVRYVAQSLIRAGIKIKSVQPYRLTQRTRYEKRSNLIQIGADVADRNRVPLSMDAVLSSPLPIYAAQRAR